MIFGKYRRKMDDYSLALKISVITNILLIVLTISIFFFALSIYANRNMVVKIPPQIPGNNTLVMGVNTASIETVRIFSNYFGQLLGNYTPGSVEVRLKTMFQYLSENIETKEKSKIFKNIQHIRENQINQNFAIKKIIIKKVNSNFFVKIKGVVSRSVGNFGNSVSGIPYMYSLRMHIRNGSPYINKSIKSEFLIDGKMNKETIERYKKNNVYVEYK